MNAGLGEYAGAVLSAYAVTLALLAALVGASWARAVRLRRALDDAERSNAD